MNQQYWVRSWKVVVSLCSSVMRRYGISRSFGLVHYHDYSSIIHGVISCTCISDSGLWVGHLLVVYIGIWVICSRHDGQDYAYLLLALFWISLLHYKIWTSHEPWIFTWTGQSHNFAWDTSVINLVYELWCRHGLSPQCIRFFLKSCDFLTHPLVSFQVILRDCVKSPYIELPNKIPNDRLNKVGWPVT